MYHQHLYDPNHLDDPNRFQDAEPINDITWNDIKAGVGKAVGKAGKAVAKAAVNAVEAGKAGAKAVGKAAKAFSRNFGTKEIKTKNIKMSNEDKQKLKYFIDQKKYDINSSYGQLKCVYLKEEKKIYIFIDNEKKQIYSICVRIHYDKELKYYKFEIYLKNGDWVTINDDLKQSELQSNYLTGDIDGIKEIETKIINYDMNSIEGIKKTTIKPFTITLYTKNGKTWDEYKKNNIKRLVLNLQYNEGDYNQEMSIPYGKKAGKFADHLLDTKNISNIIWDRPYHGEIKGIDFTKQATQTLSKSITISLNLYTGTELFYIIEVSVDKEKFSEFIKDQNVEKNELHFVYDMCYSFFCKFSIFKT